MRNGVPRSRRGWMRECWQETSSQREAVEHGLDSTPRRTESWLSPAHHRPGGRRTSAAQSYLSYLTFTRTHTHVCYFVFLILFSTICLNVIMFILSCLYDF